MSNNQQTQMCTKCNNSFSAELTKGNDKKICPNCKKKAKRKRLISGLAGLCLIGGIGSTVYWNNYKQSNVVSFGGVGEVNDSISVEVQEEPIFKMENLFASKAVVDGVSGSVDNIESFKRWMKEEVNKVEKNNATSISIPPISFVFEKNSTTISSEGQELISEFQKYYLQTNKNAIIEIEGYTCDIGTEEFNSVLSKNRAKIVEKFLIENNIPSDRIETKWYGKSKNSEFNYSTIEEYRRVIISIKNDGRSKL